MQIGDFTNITCTFVLKNNMKYQDFIHRLTSIYDDREARAMVRMVFDILYGMSLTDLLCGKTDELSEAEQQRIESIFSRLEQGEPIQYVLGVAEFGNHRFHVAPGVLIPRPETLCLCELINRFAASKHGVYPSPTRILDIGTGSGCIAITCALDNPEVQVTAWDIMPDALKIAKQNTENLHANVTFEQKDILNVGKTSMKWHIIASNPPYICEKEKKDMERNVLDYEPYEALFVPDDDPLLFYRAIALFAKDALEDGGHLLFEINPVYAQELLSLMQDLNFRNTQITNDPFGKQRFLTCQKSHEDTKDNNFKH